MHVNLAHVVKSNNSIHSASKIRDFHNGRTDLKCGTTIGGGIVRVPSNILNIVISNWD